MQITVYRTLKQIREARLSKPEPWTPPAWAALPDPEPRPVFRRKTRDQLRDQWRRRVKRLCKDIARFEAMGPEFAGAVRNLKETLNAQKSR